MDRLLKPGHVFSSRLRSMLLMIVSLAIWGSLCSPADAGKLSGLRDDVRSESSSSDSGGSSGHYEYCDDDDDGPFQYLKDGLANIAFQLAFKTVTTPIWMPRQCLMDDPVIEGYFPRYPYRHGNPGYMMIDEYTSRPRSYSVRLRSEYSEDFDDLSRIGMHLLLSTTSRFGIDTETNYLQERLPGDRYDHLWIGDCNVVYRFAQSPRAQWRAGIGFNWLDDPIETNYGFNFTYGFDLFPRKPFVLSTEIDWGTLGSAEAFHFRTTAGALIKNLETYIGYEYRDIDSFRFNGLVAGLRVWF